jgi:hypothetical protein
MMAAQTPTPVSRSLLSTWSRLSSGSMIEFANRANSTLLAQLAEAVPHPSWMMTDR